MALISINNILEKRVSEVPHQEYTERKISDKKHSQPIRFDHNYTSNPISDAGKRIIMIKKT